MLLLEPNRVVPIGRLVAALWDESPPATAKSQVQICVSALRRGFAAAGLPEAIVTRTPGYLIRTADDELDMTRFEQLVLSGRTAVGDARLTEAARDLRAALSLWRGPAVAGVGSRIVQIAATRLNENRLAVWEDCIAVELDLGRHRDLVGELGELVAEHPLRERLRAQLMLSLYRAGRQADALGIFRAGREIFLEELGLDLGDELRRLEQAILQNDPALNPLGEPQHTPTPEPAPPPVIPRQLPSAVADFTGRGGMLERLRTLLVPDGGGGRESIHVDVAALTGRGGIGKTALALHVAHLVRDAYPDGQLYAQLHGGQAQPANPARVLERFLRALGVAPTALPTTLDDLAAMYRSILANRRMLVVLDDAHSPDQVVPLLPGNPSCVVIVTSRNRFSRLPGAHRFELDVFDDGTAVELLSRIVGPDRVLAEESAARRLVRLCGCLPLALRIAAAKLAAHPHWTIDQMGDRLEDEEHRLNELVLGDVGLRPSISLSYESLDHDAKRLFRRLSILGPTDFAPWVGAPLLDADMSVVTRLMDQLVEARLVEVRITADRPARFELHDLIRVFAVERLAAEEHTADRTAALHRLHRCWLFLATEAHRRQYGGDFTLIHGRAEHWVLSERATDRLLRDPLAWFQDEHTTLVLAIRQAAQAGLDELCWDLAMTSATLFEAGNHIDDWQQTNAVALAAAREAGNRRGELAMMYSLGSLALVRQRLDEALRYLQPALTGFEEIGDDHGWALTLRNMAFVDRLHGEYEKALDQYQLALGTLHAVGDRIAEAHVLTSIAQVRIERDEYDLAEQMLTGALRICRSLGVRRTVAQTEYRLGELHLRRGNLAAAEEMFTSVLDAVRESGDPVGKSHALYGLGVVHIGQERYPQAEADLEYALEIARRTGDQLIQGRILVVVGRLCVANGLLDEAMTRVDESRAIFERIGSQVWQARALEVTGEVHLAAGRPGAAAETWRAAIDLLGDADPKLARELDEALARLDGQPGSHHDPPYPLDE